MTPMQDYLTQATNINPSFTLAKNNPQQEP